MGSSEAWRSEALPGQSARHRPRAGVRGRRFVAFVVTFNTGMLLAALAVLGWGAPLHAHDTLLRSVPARDTALATLPDELRLTFSGRVTARLSRIVLRGPDGTEVALDSLRGHPDSASVLIASIAGPLTPGAHTVSWQIAGADGHPVRGTFVFTILAEAFADSLAAPADTDFVRPAGDDTSGRAAQAPGAESSFDAGSPVYAAIRWLNFAGILGVIGAVGLELLVLRRSEGLAILAEAAPAARRRALSLGLLMTGITGLGAILLLVAQTRALRFGGVSDVAVMRDVLLTSTWGLAWFVQVASVVAAGAGFVIARRALSGWSIAALGAIGLAVSLSLAGHTTTAPRSPQLAMVLDALHVVAAGGWLGTLLALVVAGLPATFQLPAERRGGAAAALVNAFSPAALVFAGISLLTGIFAAGVHLGVPPALSSAYGRTLLLKLGAFALVVVAGAWNWRRVRPRLAEPGLPAHLRRTGTAELLLAALVLAATAVLVATPPPGHAPATTPSASSAAGSPSG